MLNGWIKLHRSIEDHWVWDCEFSYGQAWIDLLINACHKPNKLNIKGRLIQLNRGEQARSEVTLSKRWKWSRNKVRRFLKNLENDGMIVQKTTHLTSIISICNYDVFQSNDTTDGTANETRNETAKGHLTEHKQEVKECKEGKEEKKDTPTDSKSERMDYAAIQEVWNRVLTKASPLSIMTDKRKRIAKKFFNQFKLDLQKWENYLQYISESPQCDWMFETRDRGNGQTWQPKGFEYIASENCYLKIKEMYS